MPNQLKTGLLLTKNTPGVKIKKVKIGWGKYDEEIIMGQISKKQIKADLALLGVAAVWGVTFILVKDALAGIGPYYFLGMRFLAAFIFLAVIYWKRLKNTDFKTLAAGVAIGFFLYAGYAFQTVGLQYTSASKAGFITGMAVVLVPLMCAASSRRLPGTAPATGAFSAALGLSALTLGNEVAVSYGDVLVFLCAVSYALHIILVGRYSPKYDPVVLATVQIGMVAAASIACAAALEEMPVMLTGEVWVALLVTALPATALAFLIQNVVQRFTSPTHTAIIFTMEPVFAAAFAWLLGGEILSLKQWAGCFLILAGMLVAELKSAPAAESAERGRC